MDAHTHEGRTYVVTGAASGIGAATTDWLRCRGGQVITSDLHNADILADLSTPAGRRRLAEEVSQNADCIDGIIANAGGGPADTMLALNFFGARDTIEWLHPQLCNKAPRAVVVSSVGSLGPFDDALVDACLAGDETTAVNLARERLRAGATALELYGSAKRALSTWCRSTAVRPDWTERGATLNVVAFGVIDTPAAAWILSDPAAQQEMARRAPLAGAHPGSASQAAALIGWLAGPENTLLTGQVLFADGGCECLARGASTW